MNRCNRHSLLSCSGHTRFTAILYWILSVIVKTNFGVQLKRYKTTETTSMHFLVIISFEIVSKYRNLFRVCKWVEKQGLALPMLYKAVFSSSLYGRQTRKCWTGQRNLWSERCSMKTCVVMAPHFNTLVAHFEGKGMEMYAVHVEVQRCVSCVLENHVTLRRRRSYKYAVLCHAGGNPLSR